jgi:hypothetical protein
MAGAIIIAEKLLSLYSFYSNSMWYPCIGNPRFVTTVMVAEIYVFQSLDYWIVESMYGSLNQFILIIFI